MINASRLLACALIACAALQCSDRNGSTAVDPRGGGMPRAPRQWKAAQNPANPYNAVGEIHNACLDYVAARRLRDPAMDAEASIAAAYDFFRDSTWFRLAGGDRIPIDLLRMTEEQGRGCLDRMEWTARQRGWLARMDSVLADTAHFDPVGGLSAVESEILASGAAETETGFPLLYVAIARQSAAYWLDDSGEAWPAVARAKQGVTGGAYGGALLHGRGAGTLGGIIREDATSGMYGAIAGFLGGGIYTGIAGSINGPAGALAGAAGGLIQGSTAGAAAVGAAGSIRKAIGH